MFCGKKCRSVKAYALCLHGSGNEKAKVVHGEEADESAGILIKPKFPEWAETEKQGLSSSKKDTSEGDDGQGGSR